MGVNWSESHILRKTWFFLDFTTLIPFDLISLASGADSLKVCPLALRKGRPAAYEVETSRKAMRLVDLFSLGDHSHTVCRPTNAIL